MIPPTHPAIASSNAERKVFESLAAIRLGPSAAIHSLRLTNHAYKAVGEIDFIIVTPSGILVLEVKGGGVRVDGNGIWHYTDRYGSDHASKEGPFKQASSAMFALMNRRHGKGPYVLPRSVPIGYGVIFPDCEFDQDSAEWDHEIILSSRELRDVGIKTYLHRMIEYWQSRTQVSGELSHQQVEEVVHGLRPSFDIPLSIGSRTADIESEIRRFTDAQLAVIEASSTRQRVLCTGGAGTGKTILALDVVRRLAEAGKKPAYVCKSPFLAASSRLLVPTEVPVLTLDQLLRQTPNIDALVLDEAQDVIDGSELFKVMSCLPGGLENGIWCAFADPNNQAGLYAPRSDEVHDLLDLAAAGFSIHLTRNCRNSFEVVLNTQLLTGADIGEAKAGPGIGVHLEYFMSRDEETLALAEYLDGLLQSDVLPRDIAILRCSDAPPVCDQLPPHLRALVNEINYESSPISGGSTRMTESSIVDFKGLEASFVAVVGFSATTPENFTEQLYTALTRAKAGAWIGLPEAMEPEITARQIKNLRAISDASG
jgi:hypothetical protein